MKLNDLPVLDLHFFVKPNTCIISDANGHTITGDARVSQALAAISSLSLNVAYNIYARHGKRAVINTLSAIGGLSLAGAMANQAAADYRNKR